MKKLLLFSGVLLLIYAVFFLTSNSALAQVGDGWAETGQPCAGLVCGCNNQGSALGKTCQSGLEQVQVKCTGQDASSRSCDSPGLITKCVNANCPSASDCGCSHEACNGGVCGCYNIGSSEGKTCSSAALASASVACTGNDFNNGACDSYVGAATIQKCVNTSCPNDQDCSCDAEEPGKPGPGPGLSPTPTPPSKCFDTCNPNNPSSCPNGLICGDVNGTNRCIHKAAAECSEKNQSCYCQPACGCQAAQSQGLIFSCPKPKPGQPGKIEGPVFGGTVPACFVCTKGDCDLLTPPFPTVKYDELDGNKCKSWGHSFGAKDDTSETLCKCSSKICCPKCTAPVVVGGNCDKSCNFNVKGPGGGCACWGTRCNVFVAEPEDPENQFDYGSAGGVEEPDSSCVKFPNAGVKRIRLNCPNGQYCEKEIVIACSCNKDPEPTPTDVPGGNNGPIPLAWYKLKDDQFHKLDTINDPIPGAVASYDGDDIQHAPDPACNTSSPNDIRCLNLNQAGVVSSVGDPINTNGAPISHRAWNKTTYVKSNLFTPESFLDYALARKSTNVINSVNEIGYLQKDKINILKDNLTISDHTQEGQDILDVLEAADRAPYVLIVRGDVTFDVDFNVPNPVTSSPLPVAIIAEGGENATGDIKIHHSVQTLGGIFIGDTLDFSYDTDVSPYPLKVKGNIISFQAADPLKRARLDDPMKPSLFVVFDPHVYLNVSHLLSVRTYDWNEVSP